MQPEQSYRNTKPVMFYEGHSSTRCMEHAGVAYANDTNCWTKQMSKILCVVDK